MLVTLRRPLHIAAAAAALLSAAACTKSTGNGQDTATGSADDDTGSTDGLDAGTGDDLDDGPIGGFDIGADDGGPPPDCHALKFRRFERTDQGYVMTEVPSPPLTFDDPSAPEPSFLVFAEDFDGDGAEDVWVPHLDTMIWGPLAADATSAVITWPYFHTSYPGIFPPRVAVTDVGPHPGAELVGRGGIGTLIASFDNRQLVTQEFGSLNYDDMQLGAWCQETGIVVTTATTPDDFGFVPFDAQGVIGATELIPLGFTADGVSSIKTIAVATESDGQTAFAISVPLGWSDPPGPTLRPFLHVATPGAATEAFVFPSPSLNDGNAAAEFIRSPAGTLQVIMRQGDTSTTSRFMRFNVSAQGPTLVDWTQDREFFVRGLQHPMLGDLDGNGQDDFIFHSQDGPTIWLSDGAGELQPLTTLESVDPWPWDPLDPDAPTTVGIGTTITDLVDQGAPSGKESVLMAYMEIIDCESN